jgi:signal transduction histidine kinase
MYDSLPENMRVMRIAAWMWVVYGISLTIVDTLIYARGSMQAILSYDVPNLIPAVIFLAFSYIPRMNRLKRIIPPLMILLISGAPILMNHLFGLRLPEAPLSNLEGMVLRQLPVLLIALVLVAWHYSLIAMIVYTVGLSLFELGIVLAMDQLDVSRMTVFNFIILIRTICFIVVGIFINQLITYLRRQQESLKAANRQLAHYASVLESLTISRERNRMSRELHDTVVHTLSGLSVQLETAEAYWEVNPETARNLLDQSLALTHSGLQETRRALKALRASPLDDLGFVKAIEDLVNQAAERGNLTADVSLPENDPFLSPDVEQGIYRITQEAVENVVHHANARHLSVKWTTNEQGIELIIQDDGIGFIPDERSSPGHFGLAGMRERAHLLGGELTLSSKPSGGTIVRLLIKGNRL